MRGVVFGFLSILALPTSLWATGYNLHVGDKTFVLSQTKYTTPSLAFGTPEHGVWYASLTRTHLNNTLNVMANDLPYSVCEPFVDTENYTYDQDGNLTGANDNVWIEFVAQRGIDSGFIPNQDTRVRGVFRVSVDNKWLFGVRENQQNNAFGSLCYNQNTTYHSIWNYYAQTLGFVGSGSCLNWGKFVVDKNKNVTTLTTASGTVYTQNHTYTKFTAKQTLGIGFVKSVNAASGGGSGTAKVYSVKIWDNGTLVRDFIPVPACMIIGDFVVPYAGMWDLVEQKFYGTATSATESGLRTIPSTGYSWGRD